MRFSLVKAMRAHEHAIACNLSETIIHGSSGWHISKIEWRNRELSHVSGLWLTIWTNHVISIETTKHYLNFYSILHRASSYITKLYTCTCVQVWIHNLKKWFQIHQKELQVVARIKCTSFLSFRWLGWNTSALFPLHSDCLYRRTNNFALESSPHVLYWNKQEAFKTSKSLPSKVGEK